MNIGLLHFTYTPVIGGVERVIDDLEALLQANGHSVERVEQLGMPRPNHALGGSLLKLDIIMVHNVMTMPFDLTLRSRLAELACNEEFCRNTRLVNWIHDVASASPAYASLPSETQSLLNHFPGKWTHVAVSESVAAAFHRATGITAKVVPNGIHPTKTLNLTDRIAALAEKHRWWTHSLVLFLPARMVRRKRIEDAIRLVESMQSRKISVVLLITGATDHHIPAGSPSVNYAEFIEARIATSPASESIHLLSKEGSLSPLDMASLYQVCDCVMLPSETEGFGLPALESAIHGKPFFCNPIATLRSLPGAIPVDLNSRNQESAVAFLEKLAVDPSIRARKSVLSEHHWQTIYERVIAPLITSAH